MSKDLLYKPNLDYDKNYYSEGLFNDYSDNNESDNDSNSNSNKLEDIKDLIDSIKNKIPLVPPSLLNPFIPPFIGVDGMIDNIINDPKYEDIFEDDPDPGINPDWKPVDPNHPTIGEDDIPDDPFAREEDIVPDITIEAVPVIDKIEKQYIDDLLEVIEDYLLKYNIEMDKYLNSTILSLSYLDSSELKNYTTKTIKDKNLAHLTDYITKSKIVQNQKLSLYEKMFDMNETIYHLKAIKIAKEQLKRYESISRQNDTSIITKGANDLLIESRLVAEKKYEENFYGLYKYLNSSVILFSECIKTATKQKEMLILLNNKEREN